MNHLIFVNGLGPNYKGDNIYEFIFSDEFSVWGEHWDAKPSHGYPGPPEIVYIKKVGVLRNTDITLELIQNSDLFGVTDAMEDIIALGFPQGAGHQAQAHVVADGALWQAHKAAELIEAVFLVWGVGVHGLIITSILL